MLFCINVSLLFFRGARRIKPGKLDIGKDMKRRIVAVIVSLVALCGYANAENHTNARAENIFAPAENADSSRFYTNVSHAEPDLSIAKELLCPTLSEKYVVGADGAVWMYASNYAVKFSGSKVSLIIRSPVGMNKGGAPSKKQFVSERAYLTFEKTGLSSPLLYFFFD